MNWYGWAWRKCSWGEEIDRVEAERNKNTLYMFCLQLIWRILYWLGNILLLCIVRWSAKPVVFCFKASQSIFKAWNVFLVCRPPVRAAVVQRQLRLLPLCLHLQQQRGGLQGQGPDRDPCQPPRGHLGDVSATLMHKSFPFLSFLSHVTASCVGERCMFFRLSGCSQVSCQ